MPESILSIPSHQDTCSEEQQCCRETEVERPHVNCNVADWGRGSVPVPLQALLTSKVNKSQHGDKECEERDDDAAYLAFTQQDDISVHKNSGNALTNGNRRPSAGVEEIFPSFQVDRIHNKRPQQCDQFVFPESGRVTIPQQEDTRRQLDQDTLPGAIRVMGLQLGRSEFDATSVAAASIIQVPQDPMMVEIVTFDEIRQRLQEEILHNAVEAKVVQPEFLFGLGDDTTDEEASEQHPTRRSRSLMWRYLVIVILLFVVMIAVVVGMIVTKNRSEKSPHGSPTLASPPPYMTRMPSVNVSTHSPTTLTLAPTLR